MTPCVANKGMFSCSYDGCESDSSSCNGKDDDTEFISSSVEEKARLFEHLMNEELDAIFQNYAEPSSRSGKNNRKTKELKVHFEAPQINEPASTRNVESCDSDLYFDTNEDTVNSEWVAENLPGGDSKTSDAVLNCPCCMSLLSVSCVRHPYYKTEYKSEFPINCSIDASKFIEPRKLVKPYRKIGKAIHTDASKQLESEGSHAVLCQICGLQVGIKDIKTNLVTFNNILASHY